MTRSLFRGLMTAFVFAFLAGCSSPESPQEVAAAFWQAMADNDASDVVDFSTLTESAQFDGYKRSWTNAVPSFGRVVIEGREATIVTRLPAEDASEGERLELVTYLVREPDGWLVDYQRTGEAILNPSPFRGIMGELNKLGEKLSESFSSSSDDFEARMDEFARSFDDYSSEMRRRAQEAMDDFGETLKDAMRELQESVEEALKDDQQAPPEDRVILEQAARDLDSKGEALDEPTIENLADASRTLAETGERFTRLSDETFRRYQNDWEAKLAEIRAETKDFFENLNQRFSSQG
ncbi:hypothetical protein BKP64_18040 [Marinobacter salinus]|uniref:DUF4878 domain-containing protein n=1 Tax=Marinobacter salinus TaxID=1874317 RepID=A0A1D9GR95_9GAMM|nr:periplasmic heavy metal sensor [Marinobacter salinus]AOY89910.1 hypothetical protein BKP64_18040 [Marinobacter salinus]